MRLENTFGLFQQPDRFPEAVLFTFDAGDVDQNLGGSNWVLGTEEMMAALLINLKCLAQTADVAVDTTDVHLQVSQPIPLFMLNEEFARGKSEFECLIIERQVLQRSRPSNLQSRDLQLLSQASANPPGLGVASYALLVLVEVDQ